MKCSLVNQISGQHEGAMANSIKTAISTVKADEVFVVSAYVTTYGLLDFLDLLGGHAITKFRFLIGLDDLVSQPYAISYASDYKNSTVKIASSSKHKARFHPKLFVFRNSVSEKICCISGSMNLTRSALKKNTENAVIMSATNKGDEGSIAAHFQQLWHSGTFITPEILSAYKAKFEDNRKKTLKKTAASGFEEEFDVVSDPDSAVIPPESATTCWIECGKLTLMGRELELKRIMERFFELDAEKQDSQTLILIDKGGQRHETRFNFRHHNSMWRVLFPISIDEVGKGLRPTDQSGKQERSPYVAVFQRTQHTLEFKVTFILDDSKQYLKLKELSQVTGAIGRTTARAFGWL